MSSNDYVNLHETAAIGDKKELHIYYNMLVQTAQC